MRFTLEIFGLFVGLVFGTLLMLLVWVKIAHPDKSLGMSLLFVVVFLALSLGLVAVVRHIKRKGPTWGELGVGKSKRSLWHLLWQIPCALFTASTVQMLVSTSLDPGAQPQDSSLESAAATGLVPAWALVLGLLSFTVVGPIVEEIVFRGVLMHELGKHVRPVWVVVLSAAIFMAIHLAVPVFPFLFVMGLFLAWMRLWHDSLWPPVLAHMCGNTIASFGVVLALV